MMHTTNTIAMLVHVFSNFSLSMNYLNQEIEIFFFSNVQMILIIEKISKFIRIISNKRS